jgi:hypothetical protein
MIEIIGDSPTPKVSKESHEGSMLCMKRIAELLDLKLDDN